MKTFEHELIICIVNEGFSDLVMDTAREVGARGGTVINARGTANKEAEKLFRIDVQPQKEMVMIVVPNELRDDVMHALYKEVGLNTPGQGIAFAMPIDNVVGISNAKHIVVEEASETDDTQADNAENSDTEAVAEDTEGVEQAEETNAAQDVEENIADGAEDTDKEADNAEAGFESEVELTSENTAE
ncbi:MAG: hypothetical protein NC037_01155 [Bacteroides sp.]|nr:hypothetical protein [Bacillota bacterium]MCM1393805.1 hypothetical protein [[Eubacterium] siraeum]MCM1455124.1 hypothetical protein [Bacteroides sp.]